MTTYFDTLLSQITTSSGSNFGNHQAITDSFDSTIHCDDPARALCADIQVICNGTSCHFKHIVRCTFVQEDTTQSR